ncbi:MAG: hypothetical protein V3S18_02390 [Dehalococcoidia bacterium]|jgi:hypothetical protein
MTTAQSADRARQEASPTIHERIEDARAAAGRLLPRFWHPLTGAAIFALVYVVVALFYLQDEGELGGVREQVAAGRSALSQPAPHLDDLEAGLAGWEAALAAAEDSRVSELPDADLAAATLEAAAAAGVTLIAAGTQPNISEEFEGTKYRGTPYVVKVRGSLDGIESFLAAMERGPIPAIEIDGATVTEAEVGYVLTMNAMIRSEQPQAVEQSAPGHAVASGDRAGTAK